MLAHPRKVGPINIVAFTGYQGHPYPRTDNTITQKVIGPPCQVRVMSDYPT
jgi:hypothetical protein